MASTAERYAALAGKSASDFAKSASPASGSGATREERYAALSKKKATKTSEADSKYAAIAEKNFAPTTQKEDSVKESSEGFDIWSFLKDKAGVGLYEAAEGFVNEMSYKGQLLAKQQEQQILQQQAVVSTLFGSKELGEAATKQALEAARQAYGHNKNLETVATFGDEKAAEVAEKYGEQNGLTKIAGDVAQGAGQLLVSLAGSLVNPALGIGISAMSAAGNATQEAKNDGAGDAEAVAYGTAVGAVEAITEKLVGGVGGIFGKGFTDEGIKSLIKSNVKSVGAQKLLTALTSAVTEGGEEFLAELGGHLANKLTIDTDTRNWGDTAKDGLYNALIGSIIGGIADVGGSLYTGKRSDTGSLAEEVAQNIQGRFQKQTANKPQNSPSGGVFAEATNNVAESGNAGVDKTGEAVKASTSAFDASILADLNQARTKFIEYAKAHFPASVVNKETGKQIGISRKGLDKFLSGRIAAEKYASGFHIPALIENATLVSEANNYHSDQAESIPTYEYYDSPVDIDGKQYTAHIRVRNTLMGDKYYGHTISEVEDIEIEPSARTSAPVKPAVQPVNAIDDSGNSIPQDGGNSNSQSVGAAAEAARNHNAAMEALRNGDITKYARIISGVESVESGTAAAEAAQTEQQESPGMERDGGIFGHSVGAAQYAEGKQVDTKNKAITQNNWMTAEQRAKYAPGTHEQITNALSMARAQERLMTDANGNILYYDEMVEDLLNEPRWTGVDEDFAQLLMQEASRREDTDTLTKLADRLSEEGTLAGQALQARQKWISDTPEGKLVGIVRATKEIAQDHKARKGTEIKVSDELIKKFTAAQTDSERNAVIGEMQEEIARQIKPTAKDVWTALRYTNMLGNFKTQERNLLGNLTMSATYRVKDAVGTLAEMIADKASGGKYGRTKSALVGGEWMKAAKQDYAAVESRIFSTGKYNDTNFRSEFEQGVEDKRAILPVGLEQYRRATNWAMTKGDVIFSKAAYARSLAGYLKANGATPAQLAAGTVDSALLNKARDYAVKQAQETTLRDSNKFSDWASKALRGEDVPVLLRVVGEGLAPFRKTPANALVRAIEYSPLGIIDTAHKAVQAQKGSSDITGADVIDSLAKTLTGTGLFALGMVLEDMGLIRATGDDEDEAIDSLMGRQDYALVIPGVGTYTLDWMSVPALIMFTGAQFMDMLSDEELTFAEAESAVTSLADPLIQMSMLSGVNDTLSNIKYSDNNLLQMVGTLAAGYVTQGLTNTLLGQLERSSEENRMSTYIEQDSAIPTWLQRTVGKASAKTPGWDYQQTEYLDEFGNTESGGGWFENLFSPGYFEPTKEGEKVYDFAQWAHDTLGVDAFPEAYAPNDVGGIAPTQAEKEQYQKTRGQTAESLLEAAESSAAFKSLDKGQQKDVLSYIMSLANGTAKAELLESRGVDTGLSDKEKAIQALNSGDVVTYYNYLTGFKALEDGATASEAATMEKLMEQPMSSSVGEIIMEGDFKKMYDAGQAGVSVRDFCTVRASIKNLEPPAGYSTTPQWREYEAVVNSDLSDKDKLAIVSTYFASQSSSEKLQEAVAQGVSLADAVAYYRACSERTDEGKSPASADKYERIAKLGIDWNSQAILKELFW